MVGKSNFRYDNFVVVIPHTTTLVLKKYLYVLACILSMFMFTVVMIFPSSWMMGHSNIHDTIVTKLMIDPYDGTQISPLTVTKYTGHPAIQFSHILPAAFWSLSVPFQLHEGFRRSYRTIHTRMGYAFLATTFLMTYGIFLIFARKLSYIDHDYPTAPSVTWMESSISKLFQIIMACWFVFTSMMAVYKARKKEFISHKQYIYRHVASGLWVALQRIILMIAGPQKDPEQMRALFGYAAYVAVPISMLLGEMAVYLDHHERRTTTTKTFKVE